MKGTAPYQPHPLATNARSEFGAVEMRGPTQRTVPHAGNFGSRNVLIHPRIHTLLLLTHPRATPDNHQKSSLHKPNQQRAQSVTTHH